MRQVVDNQKKKTAYGFWGAQRKAGEEYISGIAAGIEMQYAVNIRGIAEFSNFKFQGGKLINIFYFKLQYFAVRKMIEQGLHFRNVNGVW